MSIGSVMVACVPPKATVPDAVMFAFSARLTRAPLYDAARTSKLDPVTARLVTPSVKPLSCAKRRLLTGWLSLVDDALDTWSWLKVHVFAVNATVWQPTMAPIEMKV